MSDSETDEWVDAPEIKGEKDVYENIEKIETSTFMEKKGIETSLDESFFIDNEKKRKEKGKIKRVAQEIKSNVNNNEEEKTIKINNGEEEEKEKNETKNKLKIEEEEEESFKISPPPVIEIGGEMKKEGDENIEKIQDEAGEEEIPEIVDLETIVDIEVAQKFKSSGNEYFKKRDYQNALKYYSFALSSTPVEESIFKSKILANRAACYLKLEMWEDVIRESSDCLKIEPDYMKAALRRAEAYEKMEDYIQSVEDWKKVLSLQPDHKIAKRKVQKLQPLADKQFEEKKDEVMGQLKDLGNNFLGMFGMSTNDFQMNQDPNTGSYSFSMNKN